MLVPQVSKTSRLIPSDQLSLDGKHSKQQGTIARHLAGKNQGLNDATQYRVLLYGSIMWTTQKHELLNPPKLLVQFLGPTLL
jgi:hypothetical protein